jgi:hypothetical protein
MSPISGKFGGQIPKGVPQRHIPISTHVLAEAEAFQNEKRAQYAHSIARMGEG